MCGSSYASLTSSASLNSPSEASCSISTNPPRIADHAASIESYSLGIRQEPSFAAEDQMLGSRSAPDASDEVGSIFQPVGNGVVRSLPERLFGERKVRPIRDGKMIDELRTQLFCFGDSALGRTALPGTN
jgi:hypothetical protein